MPSVRFPVKASRAELQTAGQGLIAESFPRAVANTSFTLLSGQGNGYAVGLRAGDVISHVVVGINGAGASLTRVELGLFTSAGVKCAVTGDVKASVAGTSLLDAALTASYTVPSDGLYFPVILCVHAGTAISVATGPGVASYVSAAINGGVPAGVQTGTGLTDLSGAQTFAAAGGKSLWFGLY